jgi:PAS domain S-box-containing protein
MIYRMTLPSGRYEFVSRASIKIFGYSPEEFYRRPLLIKELVHCDWQESFSRQWAEVLSGDIRPCYEYQVINKKGETRWVNQRNTVYRDERGAPVASEGIVTDITWQKVTDHRGGGLPFRQPA